MVIPTLLRHRILRRALDRLEEQDTPAATFEVVVVADAREEDFPAVARAIEGRRYPARALQSDAPGASAARNVGWRAARAPLILFLDDDILALPSLVAEHLSWHAENPEEEVGVLGRVEWARELRITPFMRWLDQGLQFGFGSIEGRNARWSHLYTANVSLKRTLLERVSGFDAEEFPFGYEDMDLAKRLEPLGFRLLYNRAARAEHLHPVTIEEWRGTVARIAASERRFVRRYPDVEPYYYRVLTRPGTISPVWRRAAVLAGIVPPAFPWLGPRVWAGAKASYRRQLAAPFLAAWDQAGADHEQ